MEIISSDTNNILLIIDKLINYRSELLKKKSNLTKNTINKIDLIIKKLTTYTTQFYKPEKVTQDLLDEINPYLFGNFQNLLKLNKIFDKGNIIVTTKLGNIITSFCFLEFKLKVNNNNILNQYSLKQDLLVIYGVYTLENFRNKGSATKMISSIINKYSNKYTIVLFVDNSESKWEGIYYSDDPEHLLRIEKENEEILSTLGKFYESLGFTRILDESLEKYICSRYNISMVFSYYYSKNSNKFQSGTVYFKDPNNQHHIIKGNIISVDSNTNKREIKIKRTHKQPNKYINVNKLLLNRSPPNSSTLENI